MSARHAPRPHPPSPSRFKMSPALGYDGHHVCECRKVLWSKAGLAMSASGHSYRSGLQILPVMIQDDDAVIADPEVRRVRAQLCSFRPVARG
jgi:hypothetical protein